MKGPQGPGGQRQLKARVRGKRRPASSQRWLARQLNDPYVAAAKREGYRSRAAFKLMEIDNKYGLLKPGQCVIDLGAAPGGWSQLAAERVHRGDGAEGPRGLVVALDILPLAPIAGVEALALDVRAPATLARVVALLPRTRAHVVLSDMAPSATGHGSTDHLRIIGLAEAALEFACAVLGPGGTFLCKILQGGSERGLIDDLKRAFTAVRHVKPPASRSESAELYLLATGFRHASAASRR